MRPQLIKQITHSDCTFWLKLSLYRSIKFAFVSLNQQKNKFISEFTVFTEHFASQRCSSGEVTLKSIYVKLTIRVYRKNIFWGKCLCSKAKYGLRIKSSKTFDYWWLESSDKHCTLPAYLFIELCIIILFQLWPKNIVSVLFFLLSARQGHWTM